MAERQMGLGGTQMGLGGPGSLSSWCFLEVAMTTPLGWDGGKAGMLQQGCRSFTGLSGPGRASVGLVCF
jgi:hypothetical protein